MVYFEAIKRNFAEMHYGCNLQSLIVLLPGLSLLAQKCHVQGAILAVKAEYEQKKSYNITTSSHYKKIDQIYKWHAIGNAVQIVAYGLLIKFSSKLFAIPCALAAYQFYYAFTGYHGARLVIFVSPNDGLTLER